MPELLDLAQAADRHWQDKKREGNPAAVGHRSLSRPGANRDSGWINA
jgi:hypothetical protein